MKNIIFTIFSTLYILPIFTLANETFSVEIQALTLVMEKFNLKKSVEKNLNIQNPSYMAFKKDECNAKVEVTEKNGLQITTKQSFEVNVCKKQINQTINN